MTSSHQYSTEANSELAWLAYLILSASESHKGGMPSQLEPPEIHLWFLLREGKESEWGPWKSPRGGVRCDGGAGRQPAWAPQGLGSSWRRSLRLLPKSTLGYHFGSPFAPGLYLYGAGERIFYLDDACGFAPLFYQNQAKCYSTTLRKVNDTMWLERLPETWHSSGILKVLKGLDARARSCPWSRVDVPQVLTDQWHIFLGFCEFAQKVYMQSPWETRGTVTWSFPQLGRAAQRRARLLGTADLVEAESKTKDSQLQRRLNFCHWDSKMWQNMGNEKIYFLFLNHC